MWALTFLFSLTDITCVYSNPQLVQQKLLKADFHGAIITGRFLVCSERTKRDRNVSGADPRPSTCTTCEFAFHPHSGSVQMSLIRRDHRDSSARVQTHLQNHHQRRQAERWGTWRVMAGKAHVSLVILKRDRCPFRIRKHWLKSIKRAHTFKQLMEPSRDQISVIASRKDWFIRLYHCLNRLFIICSFFPPPSDPEEKQCVWSGDQRLCLSHLRKQIWAASEWTLGQEV